MELRSHVYVALDQAYVTQEEAERMQNQLNVVGKLVTGLIRNAGKQFERSVLAPDQDLGAYESMSQ